MVGVEVGVAVGVMVGVLVGEPVGVRVGVFVGVGVITALTTTAALAVCVPAAAMPVTANSWLALVALAAAVRVRIALPPPATEEVSKEPVTPVGNPETERLIVATLPLVTAVVTV